MCWVFRCVKDSTGNAGYFWRTWFICSTYYFRSVSWLEVSCNWMPNRESLSMMRYQCLLQGDRKSVGSWQHHCVGWFTWDWNLGKRTSSILKITLKGEGTARILNIFLSSYKETNKKKGYYSHKQISLSCLHRVHVHELKTKKIYGNGKYFKNTLIKMKRYPLIFLLFVMKNIKLERRY